MSKLFSEQAPAYARYRPHYPEEMYEYILNHLQQQNRAWDCGTGSGQVAGVLSRYFRNVYASDISKRQLSHAVRKDNIEYYNVSAEDTGFPAGIFDLVTVGQAIHWFDFDRFYEEVRRTSTDGALLAVFGYGRLEINTEADSLIHRFYEEVFGNEFSTERDMINNNYRTIPFPFEEIQTPAFEIRLQWTVNHLEGFFNSWSSVQKCKREKGYDPTIGIMEKVTEKLPGGKKFSVRFPVFLRLGKIN